MTDTTYELRQGTTPLVVGMPHAGTLIPERIAATMTEGALAQPDSAHHVQRLTDFAADKGTTTLASIYCRYVIDLNRSPDGLNRFAGTNNTTLCTTERFDAAPIYHPGLEPGAEEVAARLEAYWMPYHRALKQALDEAHARHGCAGLLDIHTIPADVARFYSTKSPAFSLKSGAGTRAAPALVARIAAVLREGDRYEVEVDGRFKGGYIVQNYGDPERGYHSLQIEISQANYLNDDGTFNEELATPLRARLIAVVDAILAWTSSNGAKP